MLGNRPGSDWPSSGPAHPYPAGCLAQVASPVLSFHPAPQSSAALCRWDREGSWGREGAGVQTVTVTVPGGQSEPRVPTAGALQAVLATRRGGVSSPIQRPDRLPWRGPRKGGGVWAGSTWPPGVKLSVPQLHREQGAAGRQVWGRRGPWGTSPPSPPAPAGSGPGLPPSHSLCSPLGLLLLPSQPPRGVGAGRDLLPAHLSSARPVM